MSSRVPRLLLAAVAVSMVATACGSGGSGGGSVKEGGLYRLGSASSIDSLNPFVAFQQDAYSTFEQIYPMLVQYNAKLQNPGQWCFYEPQMGVRVQERRAIEAELHNALARNEFELHYQPVYNIVEQNTCAFEALVRWRHPVPPW